MINFKGSSYKEYTVALGIIGIKNIVYIKVGAKNEEEAKECAIDTILMIKSNNIDIYSVNEIKEV